VRSSSALGLGLGKRRFAIAAGCLMALYVLAVWCEAAYTPGHIGFTEVLTPRRMVQALSVTGWSDIKSIEPFGGGWLELVAVLGMVTALACPLTVLAHTCTLPQRCRGLASWSVL
jgi:hypothetical protein